MGIKPYVPRFQTSKMVSESSSLPNVSPKENVNRILLPQEVLDLIIDEIGTPPEDRDVFLEHQRTLRVFLFVSGAFRTRALSILFRRLAVSAHNEISFDRIRALTEILGSSLGSGFDSPGRHIQEITISFFTGFEHADNFDSLYDKETSIRDVMAKQCVIDLLTTLHTNAPNLCAFFLHIKPDDSVDWTTLDFGFQNALYALVRSRSLIHLQIAHISRLPSTFIKGAHIKVLQVYQLLEDSDSEPPFSPPNPTDVNLPNPPLEIFITDHTYPFGTYLEWSPQLFARLRILVTFIASKEDAARTWEILAASPLLVTLQLDQIGEEIDSIFLPVRLNTLTGAIEGPPSTFSLGQIQNLQGFILTHNRTPLTPYIPTKDPSLTGFYEYLNVSSPMEAFECLQVEFKFHEYNVKTNFFFPDDKTDFSQWDALDKLLSGPKYPSLKQVSLAFRVTVRVPPQSKDFDNKVFLETTMRKLRDEFPRLNALERVSFNLTLESLVLVAVTIFDEE